MYLRSEELLGLLEKHSALPCTALPYRANHCVCVMVQKKISVEPDTVLKLPNEMVIHRCDGDLVVVSPKDGNWIVVSESQFRIVEQLKMGQTVGEVVSAAVDTKIVMSLLKQIFARNFTEKNLSVGNRNAKALFYLTYDCNLKCEHCYMHAQRRHDAMLSVWEYRTVFEGLVQNGIKEATFTGGEPLMRSDLWEIIKNAYDVGLSSRIFSNGTLWGDSDIEKARDYAIKAQISIDGIDEISCATIRGAGAFAKAKNVAVRLAEAGVDVEIATTPTLANIEAIEHGYSNFVKEMREKAGSKIKFKVSLDLMPGRNIPRMTPQEEKEYGQKGRFLYSIANPEGTQIPFFDEYRKGQGRIACGLGRLVFSPDGFVYVCSQLDFLPAIGNVREMGVSRLLEEARKYMAAVSVDNTIPCRECSLRYICGGGCRAERYEYVSKSVKTPSIHKPCSEKQKMALIEMMIKATSECYRWE